MGAGNVRDVMACWATLDHAPMRLLVHMALVSMDPPGEPGRPACLYWGTPELQALALNYCGKDARRSVRKIRLALVQAGALELYAPAHRWRSPTWRVIPVPVDNSPPLAWLQGLR